MCWAMCPAGPANHWGSASSPTEPVLPGPEDDGGVQAGLVRGQGRLVCLSLLPSEQVSHASPLFLTYRRCVKNMVNVTSKHEVLRF